MAFEPAAMAGLVAREVRTGAHEGVPTRTTIARRTYAVDQGELWDALTSPERLPRWFGPVSGDLRLGGRYQVEGNASGRIERCDEPERLEVTWEFAEQVSWVTVRLAPASGGTELSIAHEGPVDPDFWEQYGPGAGGVGWDLSLMGLDRYLSGDATFDPAAVEEFATSRDGIAFVRAAALGWAEAGIADGDEGAAAREAAERTVAFYTTVPSEP